jgi:UDP-N-acetylglucosamine:LPS N-acetylglucosamine transferase
LKLRFHEKRLLLICSAGGHLTQILKISEALQGYEKILITEKTFNTLQLDLPEFSKLLYLPHGGREEGLVYLFKLSLNIVVSLYRYLKYRPKVVLSTGAHTALPTLYIAKLFGSKIIFIETFAKISTPSLTGRLICRFADSFYVQWPALKKFYPRAKYKGKIY